MYTNVNEYIRKKKKEKIISDLQPDILLDLLHLPKLVVHQDVLKNMNNFLGYDIKVYEALLEKKVDEDGDVEFFSPMYIVDLPFEKKDGVIGYIIEDNIYIKSDIVDNIFSHYSDLSIIFEYDK